jgi:hypothetical protein
MNNANTNKFCVFPDGTKILLESILDTRETQSYVSYYSENILQTLWIPNSFIENNKTS